MPWAKRAAKMFRHPLHFDISLQSLGIHFFCRGRKDKIHSPASAELHVVRQVDRIGLVIVAPVELNRIYENADNYGVALAARPLHQRAVSGMKSAHRRHQPDKPVPLPSRLEAATHPCDGTDNL